MAAYLLCAVLGTVWWAYETYAGPWPCEWHETPNGTELWCDGEHIGDMAGVELAAAADG